MSDPTDAPYRPRPRLTALTEPYWTSGRDGVLRIQRCDACEYFVHPPAPVCPRCHGRALTFTPVSGRATVMAATVNHQPWYPGWPDTYVVAIVELDEQAGLRLTTNLVGAVPTEPIGTHVQVQFLEADGIWLPLFTPVRSRSHDRVNLDAIISGAGQSAVGRRLMRDPLDLTVDAVLAALADAGLTTADVDGIATYPGGIDQPPGFAGGVGVPEVQDALRLELDWYAGGIESPGQLGAIVHAALAVHAGLARHVICFRTVCEASAQGSQGRSAVMSRGEVSGFMQWLAPFGAPSAAVYVAMLAARHFHEYGTTRDQLAQIALTCRANAALNPVAIYRDPLTLDDYLAARMISEPLCLFDCDVPADGSTAIIVSRADTLPDRPKPAIRFEAIGTALHGRAVRDQWEDLTTMGCRDAAAMLWRHTDLTPHDVDVAQLYDGFSFMALAWLEALGFCGPGEGGPFVDGGARIARTGDLPLNTGGGQLSAGRLHGFGHVHEAVRQLWGEGGDRQVQEGPEVAVVGNGGPNAGCLLLTRG